MEKSNKYPSKYGANKPISEANFLTEFICERIARREKTTLPMKPWNHVDWKRIYMGQLALANKLLKDYSCREIIEALKSKRGETIYSLGNRKPIEALLKSKTKMTAIFKKTDGDVFSDDTEIFILENNEELDKVDGKTVVKENLWEKLS